MVLILWLIVCLARNESNEIEIQIVLHSQMKSVLVGLQSLLSCQSLHFLHNIIGSTPTRMNILSDIHGRLWDIS